MPLPEIIEAIREYEALLRQDAETRANAVREIASHPTNGHFVTAHADQFAAIQRDYAVLIRMTRVMEAKHRAGLDWGTVRVRMKGYEAAFRARVAEVDRIISRLRAAVKAV